MLANFGIGKPTNRRGRPGRISKSRIARQQIASITLLTSRRAARVLALLGLVGGARSRRSRSHVARADGAPRGASCPPRAPKQHAVLVVISHQPGLLRQQMAPLGGLPKPQDTPRESISVAPDTGQKLDRLSPAARAPVPAPSAAASLKAKLDAQSRSTRVAREAERSPPTCFSRLSGFFRWAPAPPGSPMNEMI